MLHEYAKTQCTVYTEVEKWRLTVTAVLAHFPTWDRHNHNVTQYAVFILGRILRIVRFRLRSQAVLDVPKIVSDVRYDDLALSGAIVQWVFAPYRSDRFHWNEHRSTLRCVSPSSPSSSPSSPSDGRYLNSFSSTPSLSSGMMDAYSNSGMYTIPSA